MNVWDSEYSHIKVATHTRTTQELTQQPEGDTRSVTHSAH